VVGSGRRQGWYSAEVQDYDVANDWIKIEYQSEPGSVYKMELSPSIESKCIKLKNKGLF